MIHTQGSVREPSPGRELDPTVVLLCQGRFGFVRLANIPETLPKQNKYKTPPEQRNKPPKTQQSNKTQKPKETRKTQAKVTLN